MSDGPDSAPPGGPAAEGEDHAAIERRLRRDMCVAAAAAALVSLIFAPWRVAAGLLLGGALSLFNFHWLRASVRSVFDSPAGGAGAARYVLRYFVVAAAVAAAYWSDVVSPVAVLVGLCSFAAAALAEGFRQLYFSFAGREDK